MSTADKYMMLFRQLNSGGGAPPIETYAEFMATKTPTFWYRFTEASGAAVNTGSAGTGFNGTVPAEWTQGQTGIIGASEAVRVDSDVNATMDISGAAAQGFTNLTYAVLLNLPTGTINANTANFTSGATSNRIFSGINSDGTFSVSIRIGDNFSQVDTSQLVPRNEWVWVITRWNGTTGAINVRYVTEGGVISPTILFQDNSATGTLNLRYGFLGLGEVVNQKTDEYIYDNSVWSDEDLTTLQAVTFVPPVASFSYVEDGLEVTFTDTSTGATSWSWDFGDGSPADTTQNPVHTYAGHGTRSVTLTINSGADSDTQAVSVNTAFNAAMVAAGMRRIYDIQETSGLVADNAGADGASGDGAYITVVLGQTDVNGTNDAGFLQSGGTGYLTVPTITGTIPAFTMVLLVNASGAIQTGAVISGTTFGGYVLIDMFDDGGGLYLNIDIFNDNGGNAIFQTPTGILTTGTLTAFYITYDGENIAVWKATSATLTSITPASSTAASPTGGLTSLQFASGGGIFGDYAATGVTLSAFAIDDAAFNSTQLGVINSAISW